MAEAGPEELRRTETGYLVTTTRPGAGDAPIDVRRQPGRLREDHLAPEPEVIRRIGALSVDRVRWSPGDESGRHGVPGEASAAALMLAGMPVTALARMVGPLGAALRAVHGLGPHDGPAPSGLRRLERWLRSGSGPGEAARLHAVFASVEGLVDGLLVAVDELAAAPQVTCLGAPGGSTVYPAPSGDHVTILVTDEVSVGAAEWDLGWVLGEFLEVSNDPHLVPRKQALAGHPVAAAVLSAHGPGVDRRRVGLASVLRWAVHLHDFASYVDWADDFAARARRLAEHAADPDGVLGRDDLS